MRSFVLVALCVSLFGCSGSESSSAPATEAVKKEAEAGREKVLAADVNPDQKAEIERMRTGSGQ